MSQGMVNSRFQAGRHIVVVAVASMLALYVSGCGASKYFEWLQSVTFHFAFMAFFLIFAITVWIRLRLYKESLDGVDERVLKIERQIRKLQDEVDRAAAKMINPSGNASIQHRSPTGYAMAGPLAGNTGELSHHESVGRRTDAYGGRETAAAANTGRGRGTAAAIHHPAPLAETPRKPAGHQRPHAKKTTTIPAAEPLAHRDTSIDDDGGKYKNPCSPATEAVAIQEGEPADRFNSVPVPDFSRVFGQLPERWRWYFNREGGRYRGELEVLREALERDPWPGFMVEVFLHSNDAVAVVQFSSGTGEQRAFGVPIAGSFRAVSDFFDNVSGENQIFGTVEDLVSAAELAPGSLELVAKGKVVQ